MSNENKLISIDFTDDEIEVLLKAMLLWVQGDEIEEIEKIILTKLNENLPCFKK